MTEIVFEYIGNISELAALVIAVIYYPYTRTGWIKWILPFLAIIFFGEVMSKYQSLVLHARPVFINHFIAVAESLFYGFSFYSLITDKRRRKMILLFILVSISSYTIAYLLNSSNYQLFVFNIMASGFFLTIVSLHYLYKLQLHVDRLLIRKEPGFWLAIGVCLFYSSTSIVFAMYPIFQKADLSLIGISVLNLIPRIASVFLYTCISISIILSRSKNDRAATISNAKQL